MNYSRRSTLMLVAGATTLAASTAAQAQDDSFSGPLADLDSVKTELVINLVVTCTNPERPGPSADAPDGKRDEVWPIIGGRFWGPNIRGVVIPGGGDFPVTRPDGVVIVDALYRLRTDDGVQIIIHNKGLAYTEDKYRLVPEFIVTKGKYDWLSRSVFISTLVYPVPPRLRLAKSPAENDRLLQIHRVA